MIKLLMVHFLASIIPLLGTVRGSTAGLRLEMILLQPLIILLLITVSWFKTLISILFHSYIVSIQNNC